MEQMPQKQMPNKIAPDRIWVIVEELEPKVWFEDNERIEDLATEYVPATIATGLSSTVSALTKRVERAQSLLISAELAIPDYQVGLRNEIHSFLHDGTKGEKP